CGRVPVPIGFGPAQAVLRKRDGFTCILDDCEYRDHIKLAVTVRYFLLSQKRNAEFAALADNPAAVEADRIAETALAQMANQAAIAAAIAQPSGLPVQRGQPANHALQPRPLANANR